jgi:hypothetical protein
MAHPKTTHAAPPGIGHEHTDVQVRPIVIAIGGLGIAFVLVGVLMLLLYGVFANRVAKLSPPANPLASTAPRLPPEPRLQVRPVRDLHELREAESTILDHYGWVDRQNGVVRIPIARAIDLLAAKTGAGAPASGANQ